MSRHLSPEAKSKKQAYDIRYARDNITRKYIPFNRNSEDDARLLEWLDKKGSGKVTGYIKGLISDDMARSGK